MTVIELEPVDYFCRHCDSVMEWTACSAPSCLGYRCLNCGAGCDFNQNPEDGDCAAGLTRIAVPLPGECA